MSHDFVRESLNKYWKKEKKREAKITPSERKLKNLSDSITCHYDDVICKEWCDRKRDRKNHKQGTHNSMIRRESGNRRKRRRFQER